MEPKSDVSGYTYILYVALAAHNARSFAAFDYFILIRYSGV